ncbi:hypothetical protein PHSY_004580 [Pseudozyma hubeiensis SY62]|uniref:Uncharacterized protein n=1 Tax=Pseudozyma hubeiensis (strain SY62) TaxID=1305764 RepID=R9P6K8_PSEHS|nr:hypothetical protein PHSY_004580 [Pseudozyma hubeiensis SY62]GAC96996.1 hypothetical protein PHSY_004580 [Pseudozyma hubeiensis SY62]
MQSFFVTRVTMTLEIPVTPEPSLCVPLFDLSPFDAGSVDSFVRDRHQCSEHASHDLASRSFDPRGFVTKTLQQNRIKGLTSWHSNNSVEATQPNKSNGQKMRLERLPHVSPNDAILASRPDDPERSRHIHMTTWAA